MKRAIQETKQNLKKLANSYVVWALLALVLCDAGARLSDALGKWPIDPYKVAHRSNVWWVAADFKNEKKGPDVALLGSSLMMAAVHGGDATHLNESQKVALHHRSKLLEDRLKDKFGSDYQTFSFALGGEMASDAYVLSRTLLTGDKQPKAIIYGIAPRDFMDNALKNPASTEVFKYMGRLGDMSDIEVSARKSFWNVVEYAMGKTSFFYGHRPDFVYLQHNLTKSALAFLGMKDLDQVRAPFPIRKQAFMELPEDSGADEVIVHPPTVGGEPYTDNLPEYRYRYSSFQEKQFKEQVSYLERLLGLCRERGIKIILVNMPLTRDNLDCMPAGFYTRYLNTMDSLCHQYQAQLIDMNNNETDFPKKYFADSAHLNSAGGKQFFDVLSERLFNDSNVSATMKNIVH